MLHRNGQACRWVIKYFLAYLAVLHVLSGPTWIAQSSQQRFVSGVVFLSACVQAGGGHFERHF